MLSQQKGLSGAVMTHPWKQEDSGNRWSRSCGLRRGRGFPQPLSKSQREPLALRESPAESGGVCIKGTLETHILVHIE